MLIKQITWHHIDQTWRSECGDYILLPSGTGYLPCLVIRAVNAQPGQQPPEQHWTLSDWEECEVDKSTHR